MNDAKYASVVPPWPELDVRQQHEALTATWLPRLVQGLLGAAALAAFTAVVNLRVSGFGWGVAVSAVIAAGFLGTYFYLRDEREPGPWIIPLGLAMLAVTHLNLAVFLAARVDGDGHAAGIADPVYALIALVAGTLWALRTHLSVEGFTWAGAVTAAILWLPWLARTDAPLEFSLIGAACLAAGAQLRRVEAEQSYDAYRRQNLWPVLWRKRLDLAVTRELANIVSLPVEPVRISSDVRGEVSLLRLARALAPATSPSEGRFAEAFAGEPRKADSRV